MENVVCVTTTLSTIHREACKWLFLIMCIKNELQHSQTDGGEIRVGSRKQSKKIVVWFWPYSFKQVCHNLNYRHFRKNKKKSFWCSPSWKCKNNELIDSQAVHTQKENVQHHWRPTKITEARRKLEVSIAAANISLHECTISRALNNNAVH